MLNISPPHFGFGDWGDFGLFRSSELVDPAQQGRAVPASCSEDFVYDSRVFFFMQNAFSLVSFRIQNVFSIWGNGDWWTDDVQLECINVSDFERLAFGF